MRTDAIVGRRESLVPAALLRLASDQRLVEQVRAGSERAFEALFDRHHRPVLAFCRHMLGSKEEAEDAVQLTFLAAYRDLGRAEPPAALRPWLYAIARHRCLSVLRARRERPVAEVALPATDRLAAEVATREDLRAILADVAHLPDDQRAALVLAELGDVSHEEIARILACPRGKVKALVFQARSSLLASRVARDTPCAEIREQLATLRGGALRRTTLRRHLRECAACSAFHEQVRVQRRALGLLLPVAPGVGLKRLVLGAVLGPSAGGAAGGAAFTAAAVSSGGLAAVLVVLAIPGGGITAAANALGARGDGPHETPTVQRMCRRARGRSRAQIHPASPCRARLARARPEPRGARSAPGPGRRCGPATTGRRPRPARAGTGAAGRAVRAAGRPWSGRPGDALAADEPPPADGPRATSRRQPRQAGQARRPTQCARARPTGRTGTSRRPPDARHAGHAGTVQRPHDAAHACRSEHAPAGQRPSHPPEPNGGAHGPPPAAPARLPGRPAHLRRLVRRRALASDRAAACAR